MDAVTFAAVCVIVAPIYALTALLIWSCCRAGRDIPLHGSPPQLSRDEMVSRYNLCRKTLYDGCSWPDITSDDIESVRHAHENIIAAEIASRKHLLGQSDSDMISRIADTAAAHFADRPVISSVFKLAAACLRVMDVPTSARAPSITSVRVSSIPLVRAPDGHR